VLFLIVIAAVTLFFLHVGWRLSLNRPNRYGSFFGPIGWWLLAVMFCATAIALTTVAFTADGVEGLAALVPGAGCLALAYLCYRCARKFRRPAPARR